MRYRWLWPLAVAVTVCIASGNAIEAPFVPKVLVAPDKIAHVAVFGLIATLIYRALPQSNAGASGNRQVGALAGERAEGLGGASGGGQACGTAKNRFCATLTNSAHLRSLIAIGLTAAFGMSDEIHQSFNPSRTFDIYDFAADAIGAVLAVGAYRWLPVYRRALETQLLRPGQRRAMQVDRQ